MSKLKNVFSRKKSKDVSSLGSNVSFKGIDNGNIIPYMIDEKSLSTFNKAVWKGDLEKVKKLMKANYKKVDNQKRTALHLAAAKGHLHIIKELVTNYQNEIIDLTDDAGKTALYKAVERGIIENVEWLFQKSNKKDIVDISGNNMIHACCYEKNKEVLSFLLNKEVFSNIQNKEGSYPLHICSEKDFPIGIDYILKYYNEVNMVDMNGRTPLIIAAQKDRIECLEKLLKAGADVDICDNEGQKAADYAKLYDHLKCFELLTNTDRIISNRSIKKSLPSPKTAESKQNERTNNEDNGSIEESVEESEEDNKSYKVPLAPPNFMDGISTPSTSFPNPSDHEKKPTETILNSENEENESIWSNDEIDVKHVIQNQQPIQSAIKEPIQKYNQIQQYVNDNDDWDSSENSESYVQNSGEIKEQFITKSPVPYDNSIDNLDSIDEEDDSDLKTTVIPSDGHSPINAQSLGKPPKSPSNLKDIPQIQIEDMDQKKKKPAPKIRSHVTNNSNGAMGDNLSYCSTENDSHQNSLIDSESLFGDQKSIQEYQKKCGQIESRLRKVESERDALQQKVSELNTVIQKNDVERQKIIRDNRKLEDSNLEKSDELSNAQLKFNKAEEQLKKREEEYYNLQKSKQEVEKKFSELERDNILCNSKIKQLQEEIDNIIEEKTKISQQKSEFEENHKLFESQKKELEEQVKYLENKLFEEEKEMKRLIKDKNDHFEKSKLEKEKLEDDLKRKQEDCDIQIAEMKQLKDTIKKLNVDLESSNRSSAEIHRLEMDLKDLKKENEVKQKKIEDLLSNNDELNQKLSQAGLENKKIKERIGSSDTDHMKDKDTIDRLEMELRRAENEARELERLLSIRSKEVKEAVEKNKILEDEIENLKDDSQGVVEYLNKTIDSAIVQHSNSPELLDVLQSIRKSAVQIKMHDIPKGYGDSFDGSVELLKAKSQIKSLEEELERKRIEYQKSIEDVRRNHLDSSNSNGDIEPIYERKLKHVLNNIDSQLKYMADMLIVQKQHIGLLENAESDHQKKVERQTKTLNYKNQECTRLNEINTHLNSSIRDEKLKNQMSLEKEKSISNQLRMEIKRSKHMRELLEGVKEVLERFNKDFDYPVNLMADPCMISNEGVDLEMGVLNNLPRLCTRMLEYLKEKNEELHDSLKKSELKLSHKSDLASSSDTPPLALQNQLQQLTSSMEYQRQNREKLDKIRDDSEFQLRNELYQLRQKSTMEVNELLDANVSLEKERSRLQSELRALQDSLNRERQTKDTLTEQLISIVKQQQCSNSQMMMNGYASQLGLPPTSQPYNTTNFSQNTLPHTEDWHQRNISASMFNINSSQTMPKSLGNEDVELRNHLKQELDRSIAKHLASGKPIHQLNIKDKIRSINVTRYKPTA